MGVNPLHTMKSAEWFSPSPIVEAARSVLGTIDLDPASCSEANKTVKATKIYTKEDDGLKQSWKGTIFLNSPGGKGLVPAFWDKLISEYQFGEVTSAIWVGYSLEQLQTLQKFWPCPLDFPLCFTSKRISFLSPDGVGNSPTHSNYITYLSPYLTDGGPDVERFQQYFSPFGRVVIPQDSGL